MPSLKSTQMLKKVKERGIKEGEERRGQRRAEGRCSSNPDSERQKRCLLDDKDPRLHGWLMSSHVGLSWIPRWEECLQLPHICPAAVLRRQSCGSSMPSPAVECLFMFLFAIKPLLLFIVSWHPTFLKLKFLATNLGDFFFSFRLLKDVKHHLPKWSPSLSILIRRKKAATPCPSLSFFNSPSHPQETETRGHKSYLLSPCLRGGIPCLPPTARWPYFPSFYS